MADVHEPDIRSYNMSQIKGKNTKPEILVRKYLHANGYRFRIHGKYKGQTLAGKPDIVLSKYKVVVFVHGCFWHAHEGCKYFKIPDTRTEWWTEKLYGNKKRDEEHHLQLIEMGWKTITIWTCNLKVKLLDNTLINLLIQLDKIQN